MHAANAVRPFVLAHQAERHERDAARAVPARRREAGEDLRSTRSDGNARRAGWTRPSSGWTSTGEVARASADVSGPGGGERKTARLQSRHVPRTYVSLRQGSEDVRHAHFKGRPGDCEPAAALEGIKLVGRGHSIARVASGVTVFARGAIGVRVARCPDAVAVVGKARVELGVARVGAGAIADRVASRAREALTGDALLRREAAILAVRAVRLDRAGLSHTRAVRINALCEDLIAFLPSRTVARDFAGGIGNATYRSLPTVGATT